MRSGGCDRSASITTIRSCRARGIANRTERDRSRGRSRRVSIRMGRRCASSATTASLPSPESSSARISSHSMPAPSRAARTRSASAGMFAASRYVGTTMETDWLCDRDIGLKSSRTRVPRFDGGDRGAGRIPRTDCRHAESLTVVCVVWMGPRGVHASDVVLWMRTATSPSLPGRTFSPHVRLSVPGYATCACDSPPVTVAALSPMLAHRSPGMIRHQLPGGGSISRSEPLWRALCVAWKVCRVSVQARLRCSVFGAGGPGAVRGIRRSSLGLPVAALGRSVPAASSSTRERS